MNGLAKYGIQLMLLDKQKVVLSSRATRPVMRMLWLRVLASVKLVCFFYARIPSLSLLTNLICRLGSPERPDFPE